MELQITQTRHPKSVADRGTDEQTTAGSGPTTRPAFAKAMQVKTICLQTLPGGRHNNMRYAPGTIIIKTRAEVKVTVTQKCHVPLFHPKMHSYTKFGNPTSKNIGDMHQTQCSFWKLGQMSRSRSQ